MRIAFLCKRRYMSKDVILDRYARLYEIPFQLARLGHEVRGFCLDYRRSAEGEWTHDAAPNSLRWQSRSLGRLYVPALMAWPPRMLRQLRAFRPDVIIGASDIPHIALGAWLARKLEVPFVADLYDNFEGFGQARIPGFVPLLRRAVRGADLVTTTSKLLRELVIDVYGARGKVVSMPSTVDKSIFRPRDRLACRRSLGLPESARLIGTAGGLLANRGIGVLYEAWKAIESHHDDVHLVLAGPTSNTLPPPSGTRVHYLGMLSHARTAELFAALDVGVIYLADTPFGRYCFPQKAYEMLACELPIVGASIGAMPGLLASLPKTMYQADDATNLVHALQYQLEQPELPQVTIEDWAQVIGRMEQHLQSLVHKIK